MSGSSMQCLSCKTNLYYKTGNVYSVACSAYIASPCWATSNGYHTTNGPGNCKECYVKVRDRAEELERENKRLKANVDFLRHSSLSSADDHPRSSPLCSDVTLVASDDSPDNPIPANKFVLASRSPVFKAMLEIAMEESISGTIKISDVTHDSLHAFVNYLYTADVCLDDKTARDLLVLADKYQVKHLNELCQGYLVSNQNCDNSVSNYAFAYKHSAVKLLETSLSIIIDNMDKFMTRDDYCELVKKDPSFVVGIFEAFTKKQVNAASKKESS
ncbi:hypothetical protein Dimus_024105 [Dionaea muscipula]